MSTVSVYIPPHVLAMTDEEHARTELSRYYTGETLEFRVTETLQFLGHVTNIKEFDFCEELYTNAKGITEVRLVWTQRSNLQ